jgi:hypothetical protein
MAKGLSAADASGLRTVAANTAPMAGNKGLIFFMALLL